MEQIITPILAAQMFFVFIVVFALIICWLMDEILAVVTLIMIFGTVWYGINNLSRTLHELYGYDWFRSLLHMVREFEPGLITTWDELGALVAFGGGAILAWVIAITFAIMIPASNVIRGTELLSGKKMLRRLKRYGKVKFPALMGQFYIPYQLETRSLALFGEPGSGKTQLILRLLASLRKRIDRVVAMDVGGDLYRKLANKGDRLLSVISEGSEEWSPFSEIKSLNDCHTIANALIPSGFGESSTWNGYARELLTVFLRECWKRKQCTNSHLLHLVKIAGKEELKELVSGTSAQRLFESGSEKMLSNVQSILSKNLSSLELLNPNAGENSFSLREWVNNEHQRGWLWITYDDRTAAVTAPLRAAWIDILARTILSLDPDSDRRIWISLDELASNEKIDVLSQVEARGRKYGLSLILGIQNIAQLFSIYGRDEATSILGSVGNMVVLRTPDADTSDYLSRTIGEAEIVREQVSVSSQSGSTTQKVRETQRTVLASEISKLPDLRGYIKFAGVGWSKLKVPVLKLKDKATIRKKFESLQGGSRSSGFDISAESRSSAVHSILDDI